MDNSGQVPVYKRILLKVTGEGLAGEQGYGIDHDKLHQYALEISSIHQLGVQIALVVGGGNIFRGLSKAADGFERASADYMGMLATVMNALALQSALEKHDMETRVLSAIEMSAICEPYIRRRAMRHLDKGRVIIFAAGTGNPFFSTDTAAALRGNEIGANLIIKATKVDGVYDKDPMKFPDATMFDTITYREVIDRDLHVMDSTATALCMENNMPIMVFNFMKPGNLKKLITGEKVGTLVTGGPKND